jgi:uncharacterized protein (TIGR00369 family)
LSAVDEHPTPRPTPLPWIDEPDFRCFGCSPRNPFGLALEMTLAEGRVTSDIVFDERYASYPGIVHGGILGVVVDEIMGDAIALQHEVLAFSISLRTKYLEPVAVGRAYRATAEVRRRSEEMFAAEAEISDDAGQAVVLATGTFQQIRLDQARRHMHLDDGAVLRMGHYFG